MSSTFKPGQEIFGPDGRVHTVYSDKRKSGGRLWIRGYSTRTRAGKDTWTRHELHEFGGPYLLVEGNEELLAFQERKRLALLPLDRGVDDLRRRQARVRAFVELTTRAMAEGQASSGLIQRARTGEESRTAESWQAFMAEVGSPLTDDWRRPYKASLPYGIGRAIEVEGKEGRTMLVLLPPEFSVAPTPSAEQTIEKGLK